MGYVQDLRESLERSGATNNLSLNNKLMLAGAKNNDPFGTLDTQQDLQWSGQYANTRALHSYFDYFFTGQDVQVYIDGIDKPDPEAELPIANLAFEIEQQKRPLFGFWSYTFDSVMRGTRVVSGVMTLHTTTTDYMARQLSKAATARVNRNAKYVIRGLDRDEKLINQYWGRNINDDSYYSQGRNMFSSHPPFNLVIVYGIQSSSITENSGDKYREIVTNYRDDTPLMTDVNERLVETTPDNSMRIVLENCEITKMGTSYSPDGSPLMEQYQFFARDMITPRLTTNYIPAPFNQSTVVAGTPAAHPPPLT